MPILISKLNDGTQMLYFVEIQAHDGKKVNKQTNQPAPNNL